jgi:lysine 2,3-aminomutase
MRTLKTLPELVADGLVRPDAAPALDDIAARYAIAVTPEMASLIDRDDPSDPIARQFVPTAAEGHTLPAESADPIGDARHEAVPGVIHRYQDRVLLKLTHACPVYCRFCFRREMVGPGGEQGLSGGALDRAIDYIASKAHIHEVILTGGDPFILSPRRIAEVTARLSAIEHVAVLRWHTRVPVVDPGRVTDGLVQALKTRKRAVFVALHANHAREFTDPARAAIDRIIDAGIPMVSQSVLLKGVNDTPATLEALMRAFLANRIKPYYLHHPDLAPGTAHFRMTIEDGQALMRTIRGRLSGLAQPIYIVEIPGGVAKVPIGPGYVTPDGILAPDGTTHPRPDRV